MRAAATLALPAAVLLVVRLLKKRMQDKRLPPGSRGNFLMGEFLSYIVDTHGFFAERFAKFGGGSFLTNLFFKDTVVLKPTAANLKLFASQNQMGWPGHFPAIVGQTALAMVNGAIHKKQRAMSGRAFNAKMLDSYIPSFQSLTRQHLDRWTLAKEPKDMREDIKFYTFELAQRVLLGVDLPEAKSRELMNWMGTSVEGLASLLPINMPGFHFRKCVLARKQLAAAYQTIIEDKRSNLAKTASCMLDYVMDNGKEAASMSDVELQDFCYGMSFAGHDTTLSTMQTLLYYLSLHPAVVDELRSEVDEAWDGKAPLSREMLQNAVKCQAFIMEVMRLLPPVAWIARELTSPATVDGYDLPAGMTIMFAVKSLMDVNCLEHNQNNIDKLEIGRWFDGNGKFVGQTKLYDFASFSPFGTGGRMCIGYKFAMDEQIVFLMTLLKGYDFSVESAKKVVFPFAYMQVTSSFSKRLTGEDIVGA
jgi:cytochrome P450